MCNIIDKGVYMLRIGICDDEPKAREAITFALEKILDDDTEQIVYEFSNGQTAINWLKSHPGEIDLLFLDVEMTPVNGLETAKEIRTFNPDILLVFLTGYTDYVYEGYRVNALDYLLKPVNPQLLNEVMKRVREKINSMQDTYLTFHNADGTYRIRQKDILYLYSDKRLVYLVTAEKQISYYDKLDRLQNILDTSFIRIHQRYLINSRHVSFIGSSNVTMTNKDILPISRSQKTNVTNTLAKLILEE